MRAMFVTSTLTLLLAAGAIATTSVAIPNTAEAVVCARGVYRAGCVGPHGAAVVHRRPPVAAGCRYVNGRRVCGAVR
jgi:hypothetical protein